MVSACTIVARNYLAHARVLAESFYAHHPGGRFTVLIIDDESRSVDFGNEAFPCVRLSDIGLDTAEIGQLAAIYDVTELATAVKPPFLKHLLAGGLTDVIYLDPDIKLFGSLEEVSQLAREHAIVLTPHTMETPPKDGRKIDPFQILAAGVYNLGFIAVGPGSGTFIDWWWGKTRREARSDPTRMMFTDQRWVDFVPCFFDHFILKDPAYNVAYWNLHARTLKRNGTGYLIDGQPLKFFHFSGFDSRKPYLLSKHQGERPRILLSEHPDLARLCREYLEDLERAGVAKQAGLSYGWDTLPSGIKFDRRMRRVYREAIEAHEHGDASAPPNPFLASDESRFMVWLNEPLTNGFRPQMSRYLDALYRDRDDVRQAFPDVMGRDREGFLRWVRTDGVTQEKIPPSLIPPDVPTAPSEETNLVEGVNLAGYFRAEVGVGEAARLLASAMDAGRIPYTTLAYDATPSRKAHPFVDRGNGKAPYDVNVICVNADRTPDFARDAGEFLEGRYTAGYWFWELEHFPSSMHDAFNYVDEVWAATRFVTGAIRAIGRRPVYTIPLPIAVPQHTAGITRQDLNLPDGFMFLFVFDFFSVLERKNPIAVIRAFEQAFRPGEGPILVIKTINGSAKLNDLERLRAASSRSDVLIIDDYYTADKKNALVGLCDCYVSLHRSEGFGLTMAEAMGLGKPVIATAYSGNLDFMTAENSYLVDYKTTAVPGGCDPYPVGTPWADPDLGEAAAYMRRVYEARDEAAAKAQRARQDIVTRHTPEAAARVLRQRLDDIKQIRSAAATDPGKTATASSGARKRAEPSSPLDPLLASLDRLASVQTPHAAVTPGVRFASARLLAQNLLFRILRPYWFQRQAFDTALIDAIREVTQNVKPLLSAERHRQSQFDSLWSGLHGVQNDLRRIGAQLESVREQLGRQQADAEERVKSLVTQIDTVASNAATLSERLYATPFMDNPEQWYRTDASGRRTLGFTSPMDRSDGTYVGFENIFRGSERFIRQRFQVYLPILANHARVVDLGCGRGELLDLLRDAGISAIGVDMDPGMVEHTRRKGHAVEHAEANAYLAAQPDASVPAIVALQVVEHLPHEAFLSFLALSRDKLVPGGQLIFETVNPHAIEAFKTFWTDLSHQRPIFPEVAVALCSLTGFAEAVVFFPLGTGDLDQDRRVRGEYAVIATK